MMIQTNVQTLSRSYGNCGCSYDQATISDQMCRQESHVQLTPEEAVAAEESLSIYCKPVELYNILQRRAVHNPSFLQRCLNYKIQARRNRRVQITVSLSGNENDDGLSQNVFPLYVLLAKEISNSAPAEYSAVYRVSEAYMLTAFSEMGRRGRTKAIFLVPDIMKLESDAKSGDLTIIFVKQAKVEGYCSWGKFLVRSLCCSLEKSASLSLGHTVEMLSSIDMHAGVLEPNFSNQENAIAFQNAQSFGNMNLSFQVKVNLSAQEVGAKERNPYNCYTYDDVPTSLLPHIIRLRSGNVIFNYRYYNNLLQKTEVTEDFTCPFCLVQCASFKGLRYHLTSCHDLFNFEFWLTEEYQAVNVSVKVETWRSEIVADGVDPRLQTFSYCSRRAKRQSSERMQNGSHSPADVKLDSPETERESVEEDGGSNKEERSPRAFPNDNSCPPTRHGSESGDSHNHIAAYIGLSDSGQVINGPCPDTGDVLATNECAQPVCGSSLASSAMLQFAKTRKLSVDRADPRNRTLLQKRQFFHSHRTQPMALEQVYSDHDSEDEVDDDIADLEDRRMLDDFVDVTRDEKQIMHLWNSFVRKQRVLADGHIPWACEAFSRLHGKSLVQTPALLWCWRLFLVKLWNHSLLDARTMNNCNIIIERYQNESSDPKES